MKAGDIMSAPAITVGPQTPTGARIVLQTMHDSHLANIALCEQLLP
jgi:hypothetical protein